MATKTNSRYFRKKDSNLRIIMKRIRLKIGQVKKPVILKTEIRIKSPAIVKDRAVFWLIALTVRTRLKNKSNKTTAICQAK